MIFLENLATDEVRKFVIFLYIIYSINSEHTAPGLPCVEDKHNGERDQEVEDSRGHCEVKWSLIHVLGVEWH